VGRGVGLDCCWGDRCRLDEKALLARLIQHSGWRMTLLKPRDRRRLRKEEGQGGPSSWHADILTGSWIANDGCDVRI